jgi:1-deoxy-D-xylulose-5-phosphate synthase
MQRALDNIIHDVCLQELPVIFALDRAGFVGEDGATHHGVFDFSYLNFIPNLIIMSPSNENELQDMLTTAVSSDKPCAIRYPKGTITGIAVEQEFKILEIGKAKILKDGNEVYFLAIGNQVKSCLKAAEILKEKNINAGVVDMRFLKPIDEKLLQKLSEKIKCFVTVEENSIIGGLGNIVKSILCNTNSIVESIAIPDKFTEHGKTEFLRELYGFTPEKIAAKILNML